MHTLTTSLAWKRNTDILHDIDHVVLYIYMYVDSGPPKDACVQYPYWGGRSKEAREEARLDEVS